MLVQLKSMELAEKIFENETDIICLEIVQFLMGDGDLIFSLKRNPQVFQWKNSLDKMLETKHYSEPGLTQLPVQ